MSISLNYVSFGVRTATELGDVNVHVSLTEAQLGKLKATVVSFAEGVGSGVGSLVKQLENNPMVKTLAAHPRVAEALEAFKVYKAADEEAKKALYAKFSETLTGLFGGGNGNASTSDWEEQSDLVSIRAQIDGMLAGNKVDSLLKAAFEQAAAAAKSKGFVVADGYAVSEDGETHDHTIAS